MGEHILRLCEMIKADVDTENGAFPFQPVDNGIEIGSPSDFSGEKNLTADLVCCFKDAHLMTSCGTHPGGLKTARSCTHDYDLFLALGTF